MRFRLIMLLARGYYRLAHRARDGEAPSGRSRSWSELRRELDLTVAP